MSQDREIFKIKAGAGRLNGGGLSPSSPAIKSGIGGLNGKNRRME